MSRTIDTLLSPLNANDKEKGAIISLAILVMLADKSIGNEELRYLNSVLEKNKFGDNIAYGKFVASAKIAVNEVETDSLGQDKYIQDCVKNIPEKKIKAEVITMIKNMGEVNNKISPTENKIIEKISNSINYF